MKPSSDRDTAGTVVFIHGFLDTDALWVKVIVRLLARGWHPRAVNLHHVDDADPTQRGAILEGYRDQVLDVLNHIDPSGQRPVVVVGHSMGSQVGELVAAARPDTAVGLALIAPIPLAGYALTPTQAAQFDQMARDRNPASAAQDRRALLSNASAPVMRALVSATLATPPVTAVQELHAWTAGHPLGDQPSDVSTPVLLIGGRDDTFASPELIRDAVAPRFTDARTAYVANAAHWPHVEQPTAVAQILTRFLTRLAGRTAPASTAHQPHTERKEK
jgi:pimeloyl-ACP methyl ester carboxylesterase